MLKYFIKAFQPNRDIELESNTNSNDASHHSAYDENATFKQKRIHILKRLDLAKYTHYHLRTILVSGIGFFTDAYDLSIIYLVMLMLGTLYSRNTNNTVPFYTDALVKISSQVGALIGQIGFGYLGDRLGRKRMYGIELIIILIGTVGSAVSASLLSGLSIYGVLGIWRLFLGFGIGGDYPISAAIASEFANVKNRGRIMSVVFAMQGTGQLTASIVTIVFLAIFKSAIISNLTYLDNVWRLCIAFGCMPCAGALYFRLTLPETPRYTIEVERNLDQALHDVETIEKNRMPKSEKISISKETARKASFKELKKYFFKIQNSKILLGTMIPWFSLGIASTLSTPLILDAIGFAGNLATDADVWSVLFRYAVGYLIVTIMGTVPGYVFSVLLIERLGRKPIQIIGFSVSFLLYVILGFGYYTIKSAPIGLTVVLFTMLQFFQSFGPATTTFIIPSEAYPTRYRATGHGLSAAMGKLGVIISQLGLLRLKDVGGKNETLPLLFIIFAIFMVIGIVFTLFVPETTGRTLEEISDKTE